MEIIILILILMGWGWVIMLGIGFATLKTKARMEKKYGDKWVEGMAWEAKNPWWLQWFRNKGGKR